MSLINDALRRARQDQRDDAAPLVAPSPQSSGPPSLEPVEPPPISPWTTLLPVIGVAVVVLALAGFGGWFIWKAVQNKREQRIVAQAVAKPAAPRAATNAPAPANNPATKTVLTNPLSVATTAPATATNQATNLAAVTPTNAVGPSAPPAPAAPPPVKWPALRLQGIIFRPPGSSVVINNKTLYMDDIIEGARIVDITHQSVKLVLNGQTNAMILR